MPGTVIKGKQIATGDDGITTANLKDGLLSADADGLAKFADGVFGADETSRGKLANDFFGAGAVSRAKIASEFFDAGTVADKFASEAVGGGKIADGAID